MIHWPSSRPETALFANTYQAARRAWLEQIRRLAVRHDADFSTHTEEHPLRGPDGESLATDVLWLGPEQASRVLVLISGTHGVEAYAGSAIQCFLLAEWQSGGLELPQDTALLFVHALNPWGMAWARRCDEAGIDLNRNFIDFSQPLPQDEYFNLAAPWLACTDHREREQGLTELAAQIGERACESAISSGQYQRPELPFYGGDQPAFGRQQIEALIERYALPERELVVLDLHTGLGPWGYGELICDHPPDSAGVWFARQVFGDAITEPQAGTSSSVPKYGLQDYAWHRIMDDSSCFLTLEFGSYSTLRLFQSIIEDHLLWAGRDALVLDEPDWSAAYKQHRQTMLAHFCPADKAWQQSVLFRGWQVVRQALDYWGNGYED